MKPILDFGFLQIPTFYLVISLSLSFLVLLMNLQVNADPKINRKIAFDLVLIIMITGFLGARLTHIFYEEFNFYKTFPLEVLKFWNGGFVYFGGLIASLAGCWFYLNKTKENFFKWADFMTPYVSLAYAFGRMGCFFQGCCYGAFCELPWAIRDRHPTQLYMVTAELILLGLVFMFKKFQPKFFEQSGFFFLAWLTGHSACRFVIEFYRDDDRGLMINNLSFSQLISLFIFMTSIGLILKKFFYKKNY